MKNIEPQFDWDEKKGVATCILTDGKNLFMGISKCCPEDKDMQNEKTGCEIALMRAKIDFFKHVRDNELIPSQKVLKSLLFTFNQINADAKSKEVIQRQLQKTNSELDTIRDLLVGQKMYLSNYLAKKDEFYKKIRKNREKDKNK